MEFRLQAQRQPGAPIKRNGNFDVGSGTSAARRQFRLDATLVANFFRLQAQR
jgi:hypothetical protein